jgi:prepilin-type N-terminal cleavage/methylation domain-containing protein
MRVTRPADPRNGFTLMELLTVMAIMGILLTAGIVSYVGARRGAEMRGAVGSIRAALTMGRQHAVTKRHTTAAVFRLEGVTNCLYVFAKAGEAAETNPNLLIIPSGTPFSWPNDGEYVCKMNNDGSVGQIGRLKAGSPAVADRRITTWQETPGVGWKSGDSFGFLVSEKVFIPPGIGCKVDSSDSAMILFYSNGKSVGVGERTIQLTDKMGSDIKTVNVYPLLGLVKSD